MNETIEMQDAEMDKENMKSYRKFRNAYITGRTVLTVAKYGLLTIGALTVIGAVTGKNHDENEVEN